MGHDHRRPKSIQTTAAPRIFSFKIFAGWQVAEEKSRREHFFTADWCNGTKGILGNDHKR
jgi:hypothetical protein